MADKDEADPSVAGASRPAFKAYERWSKEVVGESFDSRDRTHYASVATKALADVEASEFWRQILANVAEYDDRYTSLTAFKLFASPDEYSPRLDKKSWDSLCLKAYRKNVAQNGDWPAPPTEGWWKKSDWVERANDVIRTVFVVKYLDGVEFLVERFIEVATALGLEYRVDFEAKDAGYYAAHFYVSIQVDVPTLEWDTEKKTLQFEVQVTTQLQDVIRRLTHLVYEDARKAPPEALNGAPWQWRYSSPEFIPNYLGHILHYLEGMIMEVRSRSDEVTK